jgi:hypothetical protein
MSNTDDRDLACRTAPRDTVRALHFARRIPDPWFRTQALACVARYAPDKQVESLVREALRTARECDEPSGTAIVSAWPIRALIERQRLSAAKRAIGPVLAIVAKVKRVGSRAEAMDTLWHAVFPGGAAFRKRILGTLGDICPPDAHWRAKRLYVDIVSTLASDDVATAELVLARMPAGAARRKAIKALGDGRVHAPRPFFWAAA